VNLVASVFPEFSYQWWVGRRGRSRRDEWEEGEGCEKCGLMRCDDW